MSKHAQDSGSELNLEKSKTVEIESVPKNGDCEVWWDDDGVHVRGDNIERDLPNPEEARVCWYACREILAGKGSAAGQFVSALDRAIQSFALECGAEKAVREAEA